MKASVVVICAAAIGLAGCRGGSTKSTSATTAPPTSRTLTTLTSVATATTEHVGDGRVPAYLKSIDVGGRTLIYDQIQFLTGPAATKAYKEDHPGASEDAPPNDYYIRNVNPKLYTLPLAHGVYVTVNVLGDGGSGDQPATLQQLHDDLQKPGADTTPFWVTISGGSITKIEEQFVP